MSDTTATTMTVEEEGLLCRMVEAEDVVRHRTESAIAATAEKEALAELAKIAVAENKEAQSLLRKAKKLAKEVEATISFSAKVELEKHIEKVEELAREKKAVAHQATLLAGSAYRIACFRGMELEKAEAKLVAIMEEVVE